MTIWFIIGFAAARYHRENLFPKWPSYLNICFTYLVYIFSGPLGFLIVESGVAGNSNEELK